MAEKKKKKKREHEQGEEIDRRIKRIVHPQKNIDPEDPRPKAVMKIHTRQTVRTRSTFSGPGDFVLAAPMVRDA